MAALKLFIGEKNYSSWSLRAWYALKCTGTPFEEVCVHLKGEGPDPGLHTYSPSGLVPVLHTAEGRVVWDTLAIIEYLYDIQGIKAIWPEDATARTHARCISAEMHAGFSNIRKHMSMNIKYKAKGGLWDAPTKKEVARIAQIWSDCLRAYGGPYLFGARPCAADAMFAPVVWRFYSYNVLLPDAVVPYMATMLRDEHMQAWRADAVAQAVAPELAAEDAAMHEVGHGHREPGTGVYDVFEDEVS